MPLTYGQGLVDKWLNINFPETSYLLLKDL